MSISESVRAQLGVLYNGSANPEPEAAGDIRETYLGVTGGLSWERGRTRTGIGAFFLEGDAESVPLFDPTGRTVDSRARLIGGLITVAYKL